MGLSVRLLGVSSFAILLPQALAGLAEESLDPPKVSAACADALAEGIAAHPEDWHMLQRVFVADWIEMPGERPEGEAVAQLDGRRPGPDR